MKGRGVACLVLGLGLVAWSKTAAAAPLESPGAAQDSAPTATASGEGAPAAAAPADEPGGKLGDEEGLLGPVSLGGFVGAGFPRPFSVEGFAKIENVVGF